jgi:hypothetical protein
MKAFSLAQNRESWRFLVAAICSGQKQKELMTDEESFWKDTYDEKL